MVNDNIQQLANQVKLKLEKDGTMTTKPTKTTDAGILQELKTGGFSDEFVVPTKRLVMAIEGRELTGKTHFALGATEPIIFFNVDLGTEGVVHKFQMLGKQILIYPVRVPKVSTKDAYSVLWGRTKDLLRKAYTLSQGTVVWDTETELNELVRLAHFGKLAQVMPQHYAEVNREIGDIIDWAYDSKLSSIFLRKVKPKWVNNVRTSEYEGAGWNDMEYKSQVVLTTHRVDGDSGAEFSATIKKCRQNPNITGTTLVGEMCNFPFLLDLVHEE